MVESSNKNKDSIIKKIIDLLNDKKKINDDDLAALGIDNEVVKEVVDDLIKEKTLSTTIENGSKYYSFFVEEESEKVVNPLKTQSWKNVMKMLRAEVLDVINSRESSITLNELIDTLSAKYNEAFGEDKKSPDSLYVKFKSAIGTIVSELKSKKLIEVSSSKKDKVISKEVSDNIDINKVNEKIRSVIMSHSNSKSIKNKELLADIKKEVEFKDKNKLNNLIQKMLNSLVVEGVIKISTTNHKQTINFVSKEGSSETIDDNYFNVVEKTDEKISRDVDEYKNSLEKIRIKHNRKAKENICNFLCCLRNKHDSGAFEKLSGHIVCKYLGIDVNNFKHCGGVNDNGIDGIISLKIGSFALQAFEVAIQSKCNEKVTNNCKSTDIELFASRIKQDNFQLGFFVTSGGFNDKIIENLKSRYDISLIEENVLANQKIPNNNLILIDSKALVDLMVEYHLGVIVSDEKLIVGIDREYFESLMN